MTETGRKPDGIVTETRRNTDVTLYET